MHPVKTLNTNFTYLGPTPGIGDLPCERRELKSGSNDGHRAVFATYEFEDWERELIAEGHNIELGIYTEPIPPVSMAVVPTQAVKEEDNATA